MHKEVEIILRKQCEIVGAKYEEINFDDDLWFFSHQWTVKQELEFIEWLSNHLRTSKEARAAIMPIPSTNKSLCDRSAGAFTFNFGWKYK